MTKTKTNAMRILDGLSIKYEAFEYPFDEDHLDAIHVAKELSIEAEQIFKTIVMKNSDNRLFVFSLPADMEVSLKKARSLTSSKEIDLLKITDLQKHTGYIRGGCSPLGMIKTYPTFIEETILLEDYVFVSSGRRGCMLKLKGEDLIRATKGTVCDFT